jgi:hypothetical protein
LRKKPPWSGERAVHAMAERVKQIMAIWAVRRLAPRPLSSPGTPPLVSASPVNMICRDTGANSSTAFIVVHTTVPLLACVRREGVSKAIGSGCTNTYRLSHKAHALDCVV